MSQHNTVTEGSGFGRLKSYLRDWSLEFVGLLGDVSVLRCCCWGERVIQVRSTQTR